ncbi:uncharacterized protein LOC126582329 [Malus sylvestris]|uniref:uncharacterized protein LOC126582329 n=1 Tax=Malus sylvestris TaxID=3752 RepID=UPI0021ABB3EC|nr:uncharacterized protein LOC126582329 [Malus sylvestris]
MRMPSGNSRARVVCVTPVDEEVMQRDMSNLNKLNFTALELSGRIYLKWVQNVKLHLTANGIRAIIKAPTDATFVDEAQKATAMIFIRRHIYYVLQTEYLAEEDLLTFWLAMADRFDHQKDIYLLKQDMTSSIYASKTLSL